MMEPEYVTAPKGLQLPLGAEGAVDVFGIWQRIAGVNRLDELPPVPYRVPAHRGLSAFLEIHHGETIEPIVSREQWQRKRRLLRENLLWLLGDRPTAPATVSARTVFETACRGFVRRKLRLQIEREVSSKILFESANNGHTRRRILLTLESEAVPAYLCVPTNGRGPHPAVICLHQFNVEEGAREAVGLDIRHSDLAFAEELARRGFVTLAFDLPGYGERRVENQSAAEGLVGFYRAHPRGSLLGQSTWEVSRAIDYLASLEGIDPRRIGCMGHLLGGIVGIVTAALDERLQAVVASAGCAMFRCPSQQATAERIWLQGTGLLPVLGFFCREHADHLPIEFHEILAQIAPRPLYLCTPQRSDFIPRESVEEVARHLEYLYAFLGCPERLSVNYPNYFIYFPEDLREEAYHWLTRFL